MAQKPQLHWSHLSMFQKCGEQYRRRFIENEVIAPGVALVVGKGTHEAIEANMKNKLASGALLPVEAVQQAARDSVNAEFDKGVELDAEEASAGVKNVCGEAVDTAVALVTLHYGELAPKIMPAKVEDPWVVELVGFPYDLAGRIDLQETDRTIRDTKTAGKSPSAGDADAKDQLTMYALAAQTIEGSIPPLAVDYLVKNKTPKAVTQTTTRTPRDVQSLLYRIETMCKALAAGVFVPCDGSHFLCNERFCGYARSCRYKARR